MIEFKTEREIVAFDGRVISRFRARGISLHFHIDFVESVEITSDKKGREYYLRIHLKEHPSSDLGAIPDHRFSPEAVPQAQAFVDEVMRAIASRQE
jgi:protein required for attachment to host cells